MGESGAIGAARLAVSAGGGRIARRGRSLLFVPESVDRAETEDVDDLFERFQRVGSSAAGYTDLPRCVIDWSDVAGAVTVDSSIEMWLHRPDDGDRFVSLQRWVADRPPPNGGPLALTSQAASELLATATDLRDGDVHADGFALIFPSEPPSVSVVADHAAPRPASTTADPPQFDELADLDVTLAPLGPVTYPDDDTDRTFRRPGDVRCPRGHANASSNRTCRVCGDPLDSTANRPGPRASSAVAGLRLPDGSVIPINRSIVVGRAPSAEGARLERTPRLVAIDAPESVSRTHVVLHLDRGVITVTDCDSTGRSAVVPAADPTPVALVAWEPRVLAIGDTIKLGGPTTLTITDPGELRLPPALEPTAPPPERNETT